MARDANDAQEEVEEAWEALSDAHMHLSGLDWTALPNRARLLTNFEDLAYQYARLVARGRRARWRRRGRELGAHSLYDGGDGRMLFEDFRDQHSPHCRREAGPPVR
jgi:hypothetical protein